MFGFLKGLFGHKESSVKRFDFHGWRIRLVLPQTKEDDIMGKSFDLDIRDIDDCNKMMLVSSDDHFRKSFPDSFPLMEPSFFDQMLLKIKELSFNSGYSFYLRGSAGELHEIENVDVERHVVFITKNGIHHERSYSCLACLLLDLVVVVPLDRTEIENLVKKDVRGYLPSCGKAPVPPPSVFRGGN